MRELDQIVKQSLTKLASDVPGDAWRGKERDWVNLYAHGYLLAYCRPGGLISDPTQICIEVAVQQPPGYKRRTVSRDLVIWQRARMSTWGEDWRHKHHPLAIMEWKVHRPGHPATRVKHEREWLRKYTKWQKKPVAYAVEIDLRKKPRLLKCTRFHDGKVDPEWLRCEIP